MRAHVVSAIVAVWFVAFAVPARAAPLQVDLGTLGGAETIAVDLNAQGQVVGCSTDRAGQYRAFIWELSSGMVEIPIAADGGSCAFAINDAGQVVGYGADASGYPAFAFLWDAGTVTVLGAGYAFDINDVGQILGTTFGSDGPFSSDSSGWVWEAGITHVLPKPRGSFTPVGINDGGRVAASVWDVEVIPMIWDVSPGGITSTTLDFGLRGESVKALNASGQVLAEAHRPDERGVNEYSAWLWDPTSVTSLGTLGGRQTWLLSWYHPGALNDRGEVVGVSQISDGTQHGFLWSGGRMLDLGARVEPFCVNNASVVVGRHVGMTEPGWKAFVWREGTFVDLGYPGLQSFAHRVNDRGQVLADYYHFDDASVTRRRAFAWFPSVADDVAAFAAISDRLAYVAVQGELSESTVAALDATVKAAAAQAARGESCSAARVLGAFQNKVAALVRSGRLSPGTAQRLADEAAQAVAALGGGC